MSTLDAVMTSSLAQNNDVDSNHLLMRPCFDKGIFSLNENACNKNDIVESLLDETGTAGITSDFREKKSMEHEEVEPEFSDLDTGWAWVVLVASFFSFALFGGSMYSAGIIHNALLERFQASVGLTAWVGALHTGILLLGGLLSTAVADRFSCRTAIIFSGLFYTGGYLATAFVTCIEAAIFTCGIVVGIGGALGYTAATVVVGFNFKRRCNLALGIAVSGVGAGACAFVPLMQMAKEFYGFSGFFICCAGMQALVMLF
ncbi:monocarboxylate transporter 9-like isoform X2 [Mya arenaria]|uniref:monocarboxylate transporter 9-like isoform X2 n=1 Tax=Mya arenaria TaxID=6604 RepID=UPI0022DFE0DF|nr:monocarboxylate transporter 9-like isoform X2 [Mya arenaria]